MARKGGEYARRVSQLRQEARERGEVFRTPAEQRRYEGGERATARRAVMGIHCHTELRRGEWTTILDICPMCSTPLTQPDPATKGRWICGCCSWYGRVPAPVIPAKEEEAS